jgi:hypothetical protein
MEALFILLLLLAGLGLCRALASRPTHQDASQSPQRDRFDSHEEWSARRFGDETSGADSDNFFVADTSMVHTSTYHDDLYGSHLLGAEEPDFPELGGTTSDPFDFDQWRPLVNVDGTPMVGDVDIHGNPYGVTEDWHSPDKCDLGETSSSPFD